MSETEDWLAKYRRQEAERKKHGEDLAAYLSRALRFFGVERVEVRFDGQGDDGEVETPEYIPIPHGELPHGLASAIEESCWGLLPGGWEINAGSVGTITLDTRDGTATLDVEWREEEEDWDEEDES